MNKQENNGVVENTDTQSPVESLKQTYAKPALQEYGSLSQTVRGLSGDDFDFGNPTGEL